MNNNTKASFIARGKKSRDYKNSNPRNKWNVAGKVGNCSMKNKAKG